jgi:hypothetical protein
MSASLSAQTDAFAMQRALQEYTEAYGGGRDADALSSISIEGTQEQGGKVYDFILRKKRPNAIRYRLSYGDTSVATAFDGITGWMQTNSAEGEVTRKLSRKEVSALKKEAVFESPLFRHLENRSNRVEMLGRDQVDGRDVYVFLTREPNGRQSKYYLDARLPHILKTERLADDEIVEMTILYRDYRVVDGYPFAFEVETLKGDEVVSLVTVGSISVNPGLLSFYFKMPR